VNDLPPTLNNIQEHKIYVNGPVLCLGKNITDFCTVENIILFHGLNVLLYIHLHFINPIFVLQQVVVKLVRKYRLLNASESKTVYTQYMLERQ